MKECPNCKELLGDNVTSCFKCFYDFRSQRVIPADERPDWRKQDALLLDEDRKKEREDRERQKEEGILRAGHTSRMLTERQYAIENPNEDALLLNDVFEYDVVSLDDDFRGAPRVKKMKKILNAHAKEGWRLVAIDSNELGVNSSSVALGGVVVGKNSTSDTTIMIFERRIYAANK